MCNIQSRPSCKVDRNVKLERCKQSTQRAPLRLPMFLGALTRVSGARPESFADRSFEIEILPHKELVVARLVKERSEPRLVPDPARRVRFLELVRAEERLPMARARGRRVSEAEAIDLILGPVHGSASVGSSPDSRELTTMPGSMLSFSTQSGSAACPSRKR